MAPKASSSPRAEVLHNTSNLKRPREDDDDIYNTTSKHARLETQPSSGLHTTQPHDDHEGALCQLTGNPSLSPTGHVPVEQEATNDSLLRRSVPQTGYQSRYSSSEPSVRSPAVSLSPRASSPFPRQSSTPESSLASLHDLHDPDTLQALLDVHGEEAFQVVRSMTGQFLDHFSFKQKRFAGANWLRFPGPYAADRREEAGKLIHVPIVVQRSNPHPPQNRDMWWNEGPEGMKYMIKFVVALVVTNAKHCKKLMLLTTKHDSNIEYLREHDGLRDYEQVIRFPEEQFEPYEPCRGRMWFKTYPHALDFRWKSPRFLDTESSYDYPHGLPYRPLGQLYDSSLEYFHRIITESFNEMETDLARKCEQVKAREEWQRRIAGLDAPQQAPVYNEDNTALPTLSPVSRKSSNAPCLIDANHVLRLQNFQYLLGT